MGPREGRAPGKAGPWGGVGVGGSQGLLLVGADPPGSPSSTDKGSAGRWLADTMALCPPMGAVPSVM